MSKQPRLRVLSRMTRDGLLLDSNLLLILIAGALGRWYFTQFKKAAGFVYEDAQQLSRIVQQFPRLVTTPSVLAETSNLGGYTSPVLAIAFRRALRRWLSKQDERQLSGVSVTSHDVYETLGFTDASLALLADTRTTVLTVDYRLYEYLTSRGLTCLNFNHLREIVGS
ncbi:MAG: hypothetical protein WD690_07660 [Vicinamibacterales bacterium]